MAVVGGRDGWLEGDKTVDDQAIFINIQHSLNNPQQPSSTPIQ